MSALQRVPVWSLRNSMTVGTLGGSTYNVGSPATTTPLVTSRGIMLRMDASVFCACVKASVIPAPGSQQKQDCTALRLRKLASKRPHPEEVRLPSWLPLCALEALSHDRRTRARHSVSLEASEEHGSQSQGGVAGGWFGDAGEKSQDVRQARTHDWCQSRECWC